jgi:hypothetical protein
MKTLLRIYLSKWFYEGLEWYEADLVEHLIKRLGVCDIFLQIPREYYYRKIGYLFFEQLYNEDRKKPLNLKGFDLLFIQDWAPILYSLEDYSAIKKLRSFQSLRDVLFTDASYEPSGKKGVKRRRIRGYRDGKASPRDKKRTQLAYKLDSLFYEEVFLERWNSLQEDIEAMCRT